VDIFLENCRLTIDDVSYIAVSEGPGSFTGIRIGVTSARALAQVLDKKTISVPTLKSFAYNVPGYEGIICPIFDARRSQVYGGAYQWENNQIKEVVPGAAYDLEQLLSQLELTINEISSKEIINKEILNYEITFFGDGIDTYKAQILQWQNLSLNDDIRINFAKDDEKLQKASSVAMMAF